MSANFPVEDSGYSQFHRKNRGTRKPKVGNGAKALSRAHEWRVSIDSSKTSMVRSYRPFDLETLAAAFPDKSELIVVAPTPDESFLNLPADAVVAGAGTIGSSVSNAFANVSSTFHVSDPESFSLLNSTLLRQPKPIREINLPLVEAPTRSAERGEALTVPLQIWEGEVITVDWESGVMRVKLCAKIGNVSDHYADIDLQWVSEQDVDLIQPGAIFYWTLYKETTRGSVKNSEELRFRRLPNWSKAQIESIRFDAKELFDYISNRDKSKA